MRIDRRSALAVLFAALGLAATPWGHAQTSSRPIRLVIPSSAGTPVDILSRVLGQRMAAELGQPIVVENRTGAGGIVGMQDVLRQPADGHTMMTLYRGMVLTPYLFRDVQVDLRRDFMPVGQSFFNYNVLVVNPRVPANTVNELAAFIRSRQGQVNFASGGVASPAHLAGELFAQKLGSKLTHVPYPAFPQAIGDLMAGQVEMMFAATAPVVGHIETGKLRALAVTSAQRLPSLKGVPTMAEAGYPEVTLRDWQGLMLRSGTPADVAARLNTALQRALGADDVRQTFARLGAEPAPGSAAEFADLIAQDTESMTRLARSANIRAE